MNTAAHSLDTRAGVQPLRILAWAVGPAAVAFVHWLALDTHAIVRMCAMIAALFLWMKVVVIAESAYSLRTKRAVAGKASPRPVLLAAWIFLWPGMRLADMRRRAHTSADWRICLHRGVANILVGLVLIWAGLWVAGITGYVVVGVPLILAGLSAILHYGLFQLVTAGWRLAGFDVGPLFRNPFAARGLNDFWTRRWNLAYVEMCRETVVRATRSWAPGAKRMVVFAFSGLLHEVAISLPVMRGFGLPTLYFVLNGAAMHLEHKWFREGGVVPRVWAFAWIVLPLPLLFHPWFLQGVVLPAVWIGAGHS